MMKVEAIAPSSQKPVILNLSLDRCIVFDFVTMNDLAIIIEEHQKQKVITLWNGNFSKVTTEDDRTFLEAFRHKTKQDSSRSSFMNLTNEILKKAVLLKFKKENLRGVKLVDFVQSLSIENQRELLQKCFPKNRTELEETLRLCDFRLGIDKLAILAKFSTPEEFISEALSAITGGYSSKKNEIYDYYRILVKFWAKGLIIFPQNIRLWNVFGKWMHIFEADIQVNHTLKQIYSSNSRLSDRCYGYIAAYFATSSTKTRQDFSVDLIRSYEEAVEININQQFAKTNVTKKTKISILGDLNKAVLCLVTGFNLENPELAEERPSRRGNKKEPSTYKDIKFGWIEQTHPKLIHWTEYLFQHISSDKNARVSGKLSALNHLVSFLGTIENPPEMPWLIIRHVHIVDKTLTNQNTFFNYLLTLSLKTKTLNKITSALRGFFSWLRDYLRSQGKVLESQFIDPVLETDRFGSPTYNSNRTHREALPPFIISEMKEIITKDDFAFPRKCNTTVRTTNQETSLNEKVFYPGTSICMYTLLDTPIRSHQARWLDSGVLDEKIYDPASGKLEYNQAPFALPGRQEGILQITKDSLRSDSWLSMKVNTNKIFIADAKEFGYTIPYISPELVRLIQIQLDWSKRYLPELKAPLSYRYYMQEMREIRPDNNLLGPAVAPLFRDPAKHGQQIPIGYTRLKRFYIQLLKETEKQIFAKYGHKIKLTTTTERGYETWAVDLHSLRVSGITNLIEAGVPIEIVQQFVAGHKTIVMTLHYLKYSPEKLRKFIEEAYLHMQADQDFVGSEGFHKAINDFTPFLLSQSGPGTGPAFEALNMGDGITVINTDGICPGTSCSTGFVVKEGVAPTYGPVPGGKRCPLCRYWITGPAHLLGQVNALNNLGYSIRKKGFELRRVNELKDDAEDSGNQSLARQLRDRCDLLNRELDIDVAEWAARYKYAVQSITLMDEYLKAKNRIIATDSDTPHVPMMTASAPLELKFSLESAHEFSLLDQITQTAEFNPGFPNREAELEKHQILSKMMTVNGIKPFLLSLSDLQAREAGNLLSALLLQQVNAQDLDEVLNGKKPLENYPYLASAVSKLEQASSDGQNFMPSVLSAISKLLSPLAPNAEYSVDQENEDLLG